jgi:ribonuclease Z
MIDVCLLGCGGSLPVPERYLTSLLLSYKGRKILLDCGEGTQVSMKILGWGFKTIDAICFTHAHADHVIGLPGLLLTIANSGRTEPISIIGPIGFTDIVKGLMVVSPYLPFDVNIYEAPDASVGTFSFEDLDISTLPVDHTCPCLSYSFYIKRARRFDVEKAKANNIPVTLWNRLQKGQPVELEGVLYTPDMVLGEVREGLKVSYFTDTRPIPELIEFTKDSDLLIGEGMYGEDSEIDKAIQNKHMLFSEAAEIAKASNSKVLWLTHFSPSLSEPEQYIHNANKIFANSLVGKDRMVTSLHFKDE